MPISSLRRASLFIRFQILVGKLLMRFERRVGVSPQMKTKRPDTAHYRHDYAQNHPDGDGHVLGALRVGRAIALRTGPSLANGRGEKKTGERNDSRLHVIMR